MASENALRRRWVIKPRFRIRSTALCIASRPRTAFLWEKTMSISLLSGLPRRYLENNERS